MADYGNVYSVFEVTRITTATGQTMPMMVTTSKEKAKLEAVRLFAQNYSLIYGKLLKVTVTENVIGTDSFHEYLESAKNDHQDYESTAIVLLHNARIDNRVQNRYEILSSDMLLKI